MGVFFLTGLSGTAIAQPEEIAMADKLNRAPAFQFYPDKWESGTSHLSDPSYRIYHPF